MASGERCARNGAGMTAVDFAAWRNRLQAVTDSHPLVNKVGASIQWSALVEGEDAAIKGATAAFSLGAHSPTVMQPMEIAGLEDVVEAGLKASDLLFERATDRLIAEALVVGLATLLQQTLHGVAQLRRGQGGPPRVVLPH